MNNCYEYSNKTNDFLESGNYIAILVFGYIGVNSESITSAFLPDGKWTCTEQLDDKSSFTISENSFTYHYRRFLAKERVVTLTNEKNESLEVVISKNKDNMINITIKE